MTKISQLTFTRFLAAFWVVFFHYISNQNYNPFNIQIVNNILKQGNIAVIYFFVLSGFLMSYIYFEKPLDIKKFYVKRFFRIYPVYLIALILSFLIINEKDFKDFIVNIFCLQIFNYNLNYINPPSWSIGEEFIFYLSFPILLKFQKNAKVNEYVILVVILLFAFTSQHHKTDIKLPFFLWQFSPFLIGMWFGKKYQDLRARNTYQNPILICTLLVLNLIFLVLLIGILNVNNFNGLWILSLIFGVSITLLSLLPKSNYLVRFMSLKPFILLGEISFSFYILQHFVWNMVTKLFTPSLSVSILFLCFLTILSWTSYKTVEIYFLKIAKKIV